MKNKKKIKIGIVGCGAIGGEIARACQGRLSHSMELVALCDTNARRVADLIASLGIRAEAKTLDGLVKSADIVVEAAGASISGDVLERCIEAGKGCLIMSVGGLLSRPELLAQASLKGIKVYIPSGALCGIDALKSASVGKIESVTLTTTKPPKGLEGAPYLVKNNIDLSGIKSRTVVFEGNAMEAVKGFPANVNVSAVLSLAAIGAEKTRVRIVASPGCVRNVHEVEIAGDFGNITAKTENLPSKNNPKTSALAIYSAIATLEGIANSVRIGT